MSSITVSGYQDEEYMVIVVVPDEPHAVDGVLNAQVHVFRNGAYLDVPVEDVEVTIRPSTSNGRQVSVSRLEEGVYLVEARMTEDDWGDYRDTYVEAVLRNISGLDYSPHDSMNVMMSPEDPFYIHVELDDPSQVFVEPGETVGFSVHAMRAGQHVEPDESSFKIKLMDYWYGTREDMGTLDVERVGKGHYSGSVVLADAPPEALSLELHASANFTEGGHTFRASGSHDLHLELFKVFTDLVGLSGNDVDMELVVLNTTLDPVPDAIVDMGYTYYGAGMQRSDEIEGTTDADGRMKLELTWDHEEDDDPFLHFYGTVEKDGLVQRCSRSVLIREWKEKSWLPSEGIGVEVVTLAPLVPTVNNEVRARVVWDELPLVEGQVNYLVHDRKRVYATGSATTDGQGTFTMELTPPAIEGTSYRTDLTLTVYSTVPGKEGADGISINVQKPLGGWAEHIDERISLEVVGMVPGSHVDVEVRGDFFDPAADSMRLECGFGSMKWNTRTVIDEWSLLSSTARVREEVVVEPAIWDDGVSKARVPLPGFMDDGERIWLMAILTDSDDPLGDRTHLNYLEDVEVSDVGNKKASDSGIPGASVMVTVLAMVLVGPFCQKRRHRSRR